MPRSSIRVSLVATAFLGACSQLPAPVDFKGQNNYSRSGTVEVPYAYNTSEYGNLSPSGYTPAASAPVVLQSSEPVITESVAVSDLPPLAKVESKPQPVVLESKPQAVRAAPAKPQASVNRWTGKPRSEVAVKPVAQAPAPKPVKLTAVKPETPANFMWPVNSKTILSGFGPKGGGKANDGINIASREGEPVWASADGEVVYVGNELQGYGNMVLIRHAASKTTTYAHLNSAAVDKYDRVKQGDIIGYVGSTGNVNKPQLHFAIRNGKDPVDPKKYLSSSLAAN